MSTAQVPPGNETPTATPGRTLGQPVASMPLATPMAAQMSAVPTPSSGIPMPLAVAPPIPGMPALPAQARPGLNPDPEWFRTAAFYGVLLRSFADSGGDGVGDLRELISRLGCLA